MTDEHPKITIGTVLDRVVRYWPLLLIVFAMVAAGVETRLQVRALMQDRQQDSRQWEIIRTNLERGQAHDTRIREIERHMTPEAIQKWGAVQAQVARHEREITAIERRLNER